MYSSFNDLLFDIEDLIFRLDSLGETAAAARLREGVSCLNGLTDGRAELLKAMEAVLAEYGRDFGPADLKELKSLTKELRKTVLSPPLAFIKNLF